MGAPSQRATRQAGQATVEWVGLCLVISLLLAGLLAAMGANLPGSVLARTIALRLLCAASLSSTCGESGDLVAAYGPDLAGAVERNAPRIVYETGMGALPVDFRSCRNLVCGSGPDSGPVWQSDTGEPTVAFVHVVDFRTALARTESAGRGYDCTGERAGDLYVQYWLYYSDSSWWGGVEHHDDDWEGMQVRISPDGTDSRATSHNGYSYDAGPLNWPSDAGVTHSAAWGPSTGKLFVSGGTHAGHVHENRHLSFRRVGRSGADVGVDAYAMARGKRPPERLPQRLTVPPVHTRWTPASRLVLIPIETLGTGALATRFAISPPWQKPVYRDPEDQRT